MKRDAYWAFAGRTTSQMKLGTTRSSIFKPGNLGYPAFRTEYVSIGIGICWDQWFPEVGRILALKGAELIFFPSAIGGGPSYPEIAVDRMKEMWILASRAQAAMNLVYVGALNRAAEEGDIRFSSEAASLPTPRVRSYHVLLVMGTR